MKIDHEDLANAFALTIDAIEIFRNTPTEVRTFVEKLQAVEKHSKGIQALCTKILGSVDPRKPLQLRTNNAAKRYMQMAVRFVVFAKLVQRKRRLLAKSVQVIDEELSVSEICENRRSLLLRTLQGDPQPRRESTNNVETPGRDTDLLEKVESVEIWANVLYQFGWAGALFLNWIIGLGTLGGYDPILFGGWLKAQVQERLGKDALELFSINEVADLDVVLRVAKSLESQKADYKSFNGF
jgi:hypothetical protein